MHKALALLSTIAIAALPVLASAATNITIVNNTDSYVTGKLTALNVCSSEVGEKGRLNPRETKSFDVSGLSMICSDNDCEAFIWLSKDCTGRRMAKVVLNAKKGIVNIVPYDRANYKVVFSATNAQIDQI